ncbi:hypothetical protein F66182_6960 [Fusarium sp. NRRL 66182]|nr:hypothetical protein F66182_6960 [Fusarium sp. NRRL 66182]
MLYVPNTGAATDPHWHNTTSNILAMAEIFTAVIVATVMTMRPCFKVFVGGIVSTVSSPTRTRLGASRTRIDGTIRQKRKVDRQGFSRIVATKTGAQLDIELQSRDRSTEELVVSDYHLSTKHEGA